MNKPRHQRTPLRTALLVALWALPAAVAAAAIPLSTSLTEQSVRQSPPDTVTIGSRTEDFRTPVVASAEFDAPVPVRATVSGVVTRIGIQPGTVLDTGSRMFDLDGVPIRAIVGATPLYRPLHRGDRGDDALALGRLLHATGHLRGAPASVVGPATELAIERYATSIGTAPDGVFMPGWTFFVPEASRSVGDVDLVLGQRIGDGDPAFTTAPRLRSVEFQSESGSTSGLAGKPMTMRLGQRDHDLSTLRPDDPERAAVLGALDDAVARGDARATEASADGDGTVRRYEGVTLLAKKPQTVGTAPASAVVSGPGGRLCAYRDPAHPIVLEQVSGARSEIGAIAVPAELVGTRVLRDPTASTGVVPCG